MSGTALSSGWARGQTVQQPATGAAAGVDGPGVQVTDQQVGDEVVEIGWPRARDWSLAVDYVLQPPAGTLLIESPRVTALVRYGVGGADYEYTEDVPATGMVAHVVAQWVSLQTKVYAPTVLPPMPVRVTVAATPGRPMVQTVRQRIPYGAQLYPGAPLNARAPRGAVAVAASTQEYVAGSPTTVTDATGDWIYQGSSGPFSVRTGVVPVSVDSPAVGRFRAAEQATAVPVDANALRLTGVGAGGWHYLSWSVQQ